MVRKLHLAYSWDVHWMRGESGKEILWSQTFELLENADPSEIHARRLIAKEVITPNNGENFTFPISDGTVKLSGRDHGVRESTLRPEQLVRREDLREELQRNSERSQPTETKDDAEARRDFWSIQGDFMYRHHIEPRVQFHAEGRDIANPTEIH